MSVRRLEKQIAAYRDGSLPAGQAEELRRRLDCDPEARLLLARHEALGRLTREAWTEGPAAPAPERLIAALRVGMARVDAELEEAPVPSWRRFALPLPIPALGMAFAALLAVILLRDAPLPADPTAPAVQPARVAEAVPAPAPVPVQPVATKSEAPPEIPVYDLAQGDSPLMLFEDGGTTFIWLMEPERAREDLSAVPVLASLGHV